MNNARYDAALLQNLANRLQSKSEIVVVSFTLIGAAIFAALFYFSATIWPNVINLAPNKSLGMGLLVGVVLGFIAGQQKSYKLKLVAQLALCQIEIEKNTHPKNSDKV
jgi:MFS-type transporter involved in bile tolerance (Atg22 family)